MSASPADADTPVVTPGTQDGNSTESVDKTGHQKSDTAKGEGPAKPGEATELLSLAGRSTGDAPADVQPDATHENVPAGQKATNRSSAPETRDEGAAPVRGEGLTTPKGRVIEGLRVAVENAAPHAAVVERVSATPDATQEKAETLSVKPVASAREGAQASAIALAAAEIAQSGDVSPSKAAVPSAMKLPASEEAAEPSRPEGRASVTRLEAAAPAIVASPAISPASASSPVSIVQTVSDTAGALGQQTIDLGISGRWIDDIAREIASVAANPGQGSFRIGSPQLGLVQVDITPGSSGSDILMTVENEAAQAALVKDQKRLVQDAQMASVRLGDIRVDRVVSLADAARGDMNHGGQHSGNGQAGAQAAMSHGNGQGARQEMATNGQQTNGNSPKTPFTRAVSNEGMSPEGAEQGRGRQADNARYA
ncbi:MAG: hypothetical protein AB7U35_08075 [Sphingobium sp.]